MERGTNANGATEPAFSVTHRLKNATAQTQVGNKGNNIEPRGGVGSTRTIWSLALGDQTLGFGGNIGPFVKLTVFHDRKQLVRVL